MIDSSKVCKLRDETRCSLMDCRDALEAVEWDIEKAKIWLRYRWMLEIDEMEKVREASDE